MTKQQFLGAVGQRLQGLPQADIDRSLDYYAEMIADRMEDGLTEEQAVASMGPAEEIAAQILNDTPVKTDRPARSLKPWEMVLLIAGSPVWFPLLLAAAIVLLAVYIVLWAVVVVLYAADLSLAAGCIAGLVGAAMLLATGNGAQAVLFLGAALVCGGLAVLWFFACNAAAKGVLWLSGRPFRAIGKRFFVRRCVQ